MVFNVGDRVRCSYSTGTIREAIRQRNTGDLFRIDWDNEPQDDDLYQDVLLTSMTADNVVDPWTEAVAPQLVWRAA